MEDIFFHVRGYFRWPISVVLADLMTYSMVVGDNALTRTRTRTTQQRGSDLKITMPLTLEEINTAFDKKS